MTGGEWSSKSIASSIDSFINISSVNTRPKYDEWTEYLSIV